MRYLAFVLSTLVCLSASAQTSSSTSSRLGPQWQSLLGTWASEASAGVGSGTCEFRFELGDHILVRTNHAESLPTGNRPTAAHNDLMVISSGQSERQGNATYWDNEGHVIDYVAEWSVDGNTLTFLSKPGPGPQFRLIYKKVQADTLNVSFDMAAPGKTGEFKTYTSGRIRRQK